MKHDFDFSNISITGRIAYSIMCAEEYAIYKYPNKDWKPLFTWMWKCTSEYFDEWYYHFSEILPEYLYEFNNYEDAHFEYLSKQDYNFYHALFKDIDKNMEELIVIPADISMIYCYTEIPENGKESIHLLNKAINILRKNNIRLPNPEKVSFSSFSEKHGWGNQFDGAKLSKILN